MKMITYFNTATPKYDINHNVNDNTESKDTLITISMIIKLKTRMKWHFFVYYDNWDFGGIVWITRFILES